MTETSVDQYRYELTPAQQQTMDDFRQKMRLWLWAEQQADQYRSLKGATESMRKWKSFTG